ncbi:uncharacterized oxidoreductase [Andreprevotia lacus DSM 23236]|uniref:Uncharacterized oxidoreductase n=1 Tax=Andreprevotia lacus DSM 23236 TaxID=1121001 RepID=A0A1W1XWF9_9NEIS|nr:SDR family NAD(P)-dependent oxidoreductase [Andreprevotia lacus]SMC28195.1 uncharacterized oxidoreductase [Andreprevotia lacus DSM 23236]
MQLAGKKVFITGGTAGIGLALAEQLLAQGCQVLVCGRDQQVLDKLAERSGLHAYHCDLGCPTQTAQLAGRLMQEHPDLAAIFNNAGVQHDFQLAQGPADQVVALADKETRINFLAPVQLNALLMGTLIAQPAALIVNITSPLALAPKKSSPLYGASKAALRSYTKSLRYQLAESHPHIRVVEVQPPLVDTRMAQGRRVGKISPEQAATAMLRAIARGQSDIYVGKAQLMRAMYRWLPGLTEKIASTW